MIRKNISHERNHNKSKNFSSIASTDFLILVTTDGTRPAELDRLLNSVKEVKNLLVVILFQCGANDHVENSTNPCVSLYAKNRLPLSVARNTMLKDVKDNGPQYGINENTLLLLSDDDCWYPPDFFKKINFSQDVIIASAQDPEKDRSFSTFDLRKRTVTSPIKKWEIMFYAVSISIIVKYHIAKNISFHESIGLGSVISQGEESLFLLNLKKNNPQITLSARPDLVVHHPWKKNNSNKNHQSLAYFLGWISLRGHREVLVFYLFMLAKYSIALLIKPSKLYLSIWGALIAFFIRGLMNTEHLQND